MNENQRQNTDNLISNAFENSPLDKEKNKNLDPSFLEDSISRDSFNIEEIRKNLNLSRRQICLLLKVDPSAWTRWMKSSVPPYIEQSLNWYYQLAKKHPHIQIPQILEEKFEKLSRESSFEIEGLKKKLKKMTSFEREGSSSEVDTLKNLGDKIQESFENILLKFRDQMIPQKILEIETLKIENRKLKENLFDLKSTLENLSREVSQFSKSQKKRALSKIDSSETKDKRLKKKSLKRTKKSRKQPKSQSKPQRKKILIKSKNSAQQKKKTISRKNSKPQKVSSAKKNLNSKNNLSIGSLKSNKANKKTSLRKNFSAHSKSKKVKSKRK